MSLRDVWDFDILDKLEDTGAARLPIHYDS